MARSIVTYPNGQTSQDWGVVTYSMVWEHDAWHVLTENGAPGPTPALTNDGGITSDAELRSRSYGFAPVGECRDDRHRRRSAEPAEPIIDAVTDVGADAGKAALNA